MLKYKVIIWETVFNKNYLKNKKRLTPLKFNNLKAFILNVRNFWRFRVLTTFYR